MSEHCGDAAAYALGALEDHEAEAFAAHLETCEACREELAGFTAVTGQLALAVPQYPAPARVRQAVLEEIRPPRRRSPRGRWATRPTLAFASVAAAAIIALVLVLTLPSGHQSTRTVVASVRGAGRAELKLGGGRAELVVHGISQLPMGRIYEVWLVRRGVAAPQPTTALFGVTTAGDGVVAVPGNLHSVTAVLVTNEPAGGTKVPTTAPVIDARLA